MPPTTSSSLAGAGFFPPPFVMSNWNVSNLVMMGGTGQSNKGSGALVASHSQGTSTNEDIILGRGTLHAKHPGNVKFYLLVDTFLHKYNAAETKMEKTNIIHDIYEKVIRTGQRFVKQEPPSSTCKLVTENEAKKKIGHTMRYRQKLQLQQKSKMIKPHSSATIATASTSSSSEAFSRSTSLQSLVTEEDKATLTKPLKAPPRLFKFTFPFNPVTPNEARSSHSPWSSSSTNAAAAESTKQRGIFSDEELDTVLGAANEKNGKASQQESGDNSDYDYDDDDDDFQYENWNHFDEEMDFTTISF